jgi:hypothetical protein
MPGCKPGDDAVIIGPLPDDPDYCKFLAENIGSFVKVMDNYEANPLLVFMNIVSAGKLFKCAAKYPLSIHVPIVDPITKDVIYLHKKQYGDIIPDKWLQPIRPLGDADKMNERADKGAIKTKYRTIEEARRVMKAREL